MLAVLDALKLDRPVLVGHSIAGEELSSIGSRHPERVAGLVYLDAGYYYAYYDPSIGNVDIDSRELQKKMEQLRAARSEDGKLIEELLQKSLPAFERDLHEMQKELQAPEPTPPSPTAADRESFDAWRSWQKRVFGYALPEAEERQRREFTPDGHIGERLTKPDLSQLFVAGQQKYTDIRVPVLAIYAVPHDDGPYMNDNPAARAAIEAVDRTEALAKAFEVGIPTARVVRLPHANHYVFLSNEADVLREIRAFLAGLH